MVDLDERFERIRKHLEKGWNRRNAEELAEAALLMTEDYAEMLRLEEIRRFPDSFAEQLRTEMNRSKTLEEILRDAKEKHTISESTKDSINRSLKLINDGCKRCHTEFRDNR